MDQKFKNFRAFIIETCGELIDPKLKGALVLMPDEGFKNLVGMVLVRMRIDYPEIDKFFTELKDQFVQEDFDELKNIFDSTISKKLTSITFDLDVIEQELKSTNIVTGSKTFDVIENHLKQLSLDKEKYQKINETFELILTKLNPLQKDKMMRYITLFNTELKRQN